MNYKSRRWLRLRAKVLRRDSYMCQVSLRYGRHIEANTVHHIFPVSKYPEYQWCEWNLISLDAAVHNSMHIRDSDDMDAKPPDVLNAMSIASLLRSPAGTERSVSR